MRVETALAKAADYVAGVHRQDAALLRSTFDPAAHVTGFDEGKRVNVPCDRWIDFVCAPERAGAGAAIYEVSSVQVFGSIAIVSVKTSYGHFTYHDVLTLIDQADGSAVVISKLFHQYA